MNKSKTEDTTSEKAVRLYGHSYIKENFATKVNKESDMPTLKELRMMVFQKDQFELIKIVDARIKKIGG